MAWQTYRNYYKVGLALWCLTSLQLYRGGFTMKNINGVRTNKFIYLFIYLFKLHITPIWVKQLQYKSMPTYKRKTTQT